MHLWLLSKRNITCYGLLLTLFSTVSLCLAQTTYYVASNGNDSNDGRSRTSPFQTLDPVNRLGLQPGDSVLFRKGDTFRGKLAIRQSGSVNRRIIFSAYGVGSKPVLSGSVPVVNWSNAGGNIWKANCPSCGNTVTGLYQNGVALPLGRYPNMDAPNKGYLTIQSHNDKNQITSQEHLPDNINWKGGEAVMRPTQWIIDRAVIDNQNGDVLNILNYSNYTPSDGWGFFIQSHPSTLDQNGEWYYDATSKTIWLYNSQTTPDQNLITATVQNRGIEAYNIFNVSVNNIHVKETLNEGVFMDNATNVTIADNDITNSGEDGVIITGSGNNLLVEGNHIVDVNNNGVRIDALQNVIFRGNTLRRVGMIPGRGKSGDGQYNGFQSNANVGVLIERNTIDSIGYNGISFWNNTTIRQNVVSNYCMTKSDGGALYVWNKAKASMTNIYIDSNIIYNGIGAPEGSFRREYSGANGIFLDDCVENVTFRNNTVFNNHQWGIYLHATSNITLIGNTSYNNGVSQFAMYHNAGYCPFRNNTVKNNIFLSKEPSQLTSQYESNTNDINLYGDIDSNYYARPFSEPATILGIINNTQGGTFSLEDWRNFSGGKDIHSSRSPIVYNSYRNEGAGGTNRINSSFDADADGWFIVYSNYNNAEATRDATNKLDGGSLRVGFPTPSGQSNSYAQAVNRFGTITKGKTYVLRFDAVASVNVNILAYLRSYGPPYVEYDKRYTVSIGPTRKSYEFVFTASESGTDAVVMFQIDGEGPTFWLDNIRLQEGVPIQNNPDDFIKLFYNPTLKDSVITLTDVYRDVKNQAYSGSFTLKPYTSVILLKDTLPVPPADLSLSLQSRKRLVQVNEPTTIELRISNQGQTPAALSRWTYRLPANLQFINSDGQPYSDNVLTGTVQQLAPLTDTTFILSVKPTVAGIFRTAAQITTATAPDPDSRPNSGTADGEDDTAMTELRVGGPSDTVFESPNPNQRALPPIESNQPTPDPTKADLSLRIEVSNRTPAKDEVIRITLYVSNAGGLATDGVQLQNQLPEGLTPVNLTDWTASGRLLNATLPSISAGATVSISFQARVNSLGSWVNKAQISASGTADPDSIPGNGFTNGEDDEAQIDIRTSK